MIPVRNSTSTKPFQGLTLGRLHKGVLKLGLVPINIPAYVPGEILRSDDGERYRRCKHTPGITVQA